LEKVPRVVWEDQRHDKPYGGGRGEESNKKKRRRKERLTNHLIHLEIPRPLLWEETKTKPNPRNGKGRKGCLA